MVVFSSDVDILKYEPVLFGELHIPNQVLASGTDGVISGTTFTSSGADFTNASVAAGQVIYVRSADGSLDTALEIVSVNSATELTVSVVRADSDSEAIAPGSASEISYRISTFLPQADEVGFQLTEYFGVRPGNPESQYSADDIVDNTTLKQASVFAVISTVYAMLANRNEDDSFWRKSLYYQRLFEKARQRCRVGLGADAAAVEVVKTGSSLRLKRD